MTNPVRIVGENTQLYQLHMYGFVLIHFVLLLLQFNFSSGYGIVCTNKLGVCQINEICTVSHNGSGICSCAPGFFEFPKNKTCIQHDPAPSGGGGSSSSGAAVGVSVAVCLLLVAGLVAAFLHHRYRALNGLLLPLRRLFRRRPSGGTAYQVADVADDLHPIV